MTNIPKKHFTPEQKEKLIALWKQSGKSKKSFSDEHGLMYCNHPTNYILPLYCKHPTKYILHNLS